MLKTLDVRLAGVCDHQVAVGKVVMVALATLLFVLGFWLRPDLPAALWQVLLCNPE